MKLFLHVCCGPCAIYPLSILRGKGAEVTGYFFNPNIHPFKEFRRRLFSLELLSENSSLPLVVDEGYGITNFVRKVAFHETERCSICYRWRLENTASLAKEQGFEAFSTTLLYSKYQNHDLLIYHCEELSAKFDIPFIYEDFRVGWQYGIDQSKELELYRQPYCGCIYSEQERYDKSLRKK